MKRIIRLIGTAVLTVLFSICSLSAQKLDHTLNEALIKLEAGTDLDIFQERFAQFNGKATNFKIVKPVSRQMNIYLASFDHNAVNEYDFRNEVSRHPNVEVIQVNHILNYRETTPDDPSFTTQWQWQNVAAELAWDIATGGTTANGDEIVVAIYDDGGDLDHPDLIANNWINEGEIPNNNIDDDNNGYVDDVYGWDFGSNSNNVDGGSHGVNVAGMVGAVGNNGIGGTGINWGVKLMNLGTSSIQQESNVIEFYSYALDMRQRYNETNGDEGAFVVATNSSWGIDGGDPNSAPLWCGFYDTLGEQGILNCGATANQALDVDVAGDLPTACPSEYMISVTATDLNDIRQFSAYGATTIDVGAPGDNIYTTSSGGGYQNTSGTSFASPLTAGIVALLYSAPCSNIANLALSDPPLAAQTIRDYIFEGSEAVGNLPGTIVHGRVNAANSMQLVIDNCGPCPAPSGISATEIVDISSTINWSSPSTTLSTNLRWREVGAATWTEVTGVTSPYQLIGLTACTDYELQLEDLCEANEQSGYTSSFTFSSEGCCVAPSDLAMSDLTISSANATWSSIFAAESYNIRIKETAATMWNMSNVSTTSFAFTDLLECTEYEVQIQTLCAGGVTTAFSPSVTFSTSGCGSCIDLEYCTITSDQFNLEWIDAIMVNTLTNTSGSSGADGYTDFTGSGMSTDVETYNTYDLTLTPGFDSQEYGEYWAIYIDYNQDGTFDEGTELAFDAGDTTPEVVTGTITIPGDASIGLTRMRIIMRFGGNNAPDPCGNFTYGETEDYCINILQGAIPCESPDNLSSNSITTTSATLQWDASAVAESYNVRYKAITAGSWTSDNTTNTNLSITGLTECTDYEFQVESVCAGGELSGFSASHEFLTICECAPPTLLDTMNVFTTTATVTWNASTNAEDYSLRYKLLSATNWDNLTINATSIALSGLEECSDYEYQVRSNCPNSESDYSASFFFNTACLIAVDDLDAGIQQLAVQPNPFNDQFTASFNLEVATDVNVILYSSTGQQLNTYQFNKLGTGSHRVELKELSDLSTGIYFVTFNTNMGTTVRKMIKQ